ncbi:hypothetical protein ACS0TY_017137 [Phlomoides rotata]
MNLQQKNQIWPDDVLKRIVSNHELGVRHTVDLYNHSRRTANVTVRVQGTTSSCTFRVSLSERACDYGQWKLSGIPCSHAVALRHNPDRRIRRRGRDVTSRIHNEMDWAQTRARQQYQA